MKYETIVFRKKETPACAGGNHPSRPCNIHLNICANHYHIVRVTAESYDCPRWADVGGIGALSGSRTCTRRVKRGNGLRRYWDMNCQGDQDSCRRLEFPFCEIEWFLYSLMQRRSEKRLILWRNFVQLDNGAFRLKGFEIK
jgi:hypothetical protein